MSFVHGASTRLLVNEREVSSEVSGWTVTGARNMSEVTTAGQTAGAAGAKFIPGLTSGTLAVRGPQDSDHTSGLTREIKDAIGVDNAILATCFPDGYAVGKPAHFVYGDASEWNIDSQVSDAVGYTFTAQADEGAESGYVLADLVARTATANGTAVDRGTSLSAGPQAYSVNGLAAALHVTAYSGFTSVAIKIQHSPDNSVWTDLVAFTNVTAVGQERVKVAAGTQINRYLRAVTTVTGTGSITYLVAAAPR